MKKYPPLFYFVLAIVVIFAAFHYYQKYETQKHLAEGWIEPAGWDCPPGHAIKANLRSMIYHLPEDPYWNRINAMNGKCFDSPQDVEKQGFRASYGTPSVPTAPMISNGTYRGGYAPDRSFCDYGYNSRTKSCCNDDDYSCEVQDMAPKGSTAICMDGTYSISQNPTIDCSAHGGVQTNPQYTPFLK